MRRRTAVLLLSATLLLALGVLALRILRRGFSAREVPSAPEALVARQMRSMGIPRNAKAQSNPVPASPEVLREARAHFADHCALCHGNDGRGATTIGRNLYPKVPDMTLAATQNLSDGELFWIIKNGVRLTGMPAWGVDTPEDDRESWGLVRFIRHLPKMTPEEMAEMSALNPRSRRELEEEEAERRFLEGGSPEPSKDKTNSSHH